MPDWKVLAEETASWLYPRRCPFCGAVLESAAPEGTFCRKCASEEERLRHDPPRLPETEHVFYALHGALAAYYYEDMVRESILLCKRGGRPWYARELADRMAIRIWGAAPAQNPGQRPRDELFYHLPVYHCIVPVPPHQPFPGVPGLPMMLARRLGVLFRIPVMTPLRVKKGTPVQKTLNRQERIGNAKKAYTCRSDVNLSGKRILLVDDIITTGATVSSCALALMQAGAVEVTAAAIAAAEDLPKEKQKPMEKNR